MNWVAEGIDLSIPRWRSSGISDRESMLLTGFDGAVEGAMYLDRGIREAAACYRRPPRQSHRPRQKAAASWPGAAESARSLLSTRAPRCSLHGFARRQLTTGSFGALLCAGEIQQFVGGHAEAVVVSLPELLGATIWLWTHLGGLGARSRRAYGSLRLVKADETLRIPRKLIDQPSTPSELVQQLRDGIPWATELFREHLSKLTTFPLQLFVAQCSHRSSGAPGPTKVRASWTPHEGSGCCDVGAGGGSEAHRDHR
jgi:hypothetical protein